MNNLDCSLIYRFINNFDELAYRRSFNNLEDCEKKFINSCFKALKNSQKLYALKNKYTLKEFVLLANNISRKFYQSIKSPSSDNLQIMDQKILNHFKNIQQIPHWSKNRKLLMKANFVNHTDTVIKIPLVDQLVVNPLDHLTHIPFWNTTFLTHLKFEKLTFKDCNFDYINLNGSSFKKCHFIRCSFKNTLFMNSFFYNANFKHCHFEDAFFDFSMLTKTHFKKCFVDHTNFYHTEFYLSSFSHSHFQGFHRLNQKAPFKNVHFSVKAAVALPWNVERPGLTCLTLSEVLKKTNCTPVKFNYLFNDVDISHLDHEVKRILNKNKIQSPKLSIPASLLDEVLSHPITYPEIYKIYSHATRLLLISKGLILPGGSDIEPEFYGQAKSEFTETEPDYRRTLFEFSLFKIAFEKKLPILGICRGSQIGNVYLGGSLKQHVKNQKNVIQRISLAKHSQAREIFEGKKHIKGLSLHHQAYDQIGKGLKQVALYQDIPKILEGTTKQFLMLVQVHAEFLDENHLLFDRFVEVLNTSSPSDSHN